MSSFKFELNYAGVSELLKSPEMQEECAKYGQQILNTAGEGYAIKNGVGAFRAGSTVYADTPHAYYSNRKHKTLQKALGGMIK